jgi:steroid 5-alpha-reductase/3-oxo-5-alpha-steroid 4-dehydrogenase 1
MPLLIALLALFFNLINGYFNGRQVGVFGDYKVDWLLDPRFLVGATVFLAGLATNVWADTVLIHLRKPGDTGYRIPQGGLYELISCPNYFAEMLEWCGWALATWSLAGAAFAAWTIGNLLPRALDHHRWYRAQFADYPPARKAVIPFLL